VRGGDLIYKEPRKIEVILTLTTGDVKQQEDQLSKQEYYKHLIPLGLILILGVYSTLVSRVGLLAA
jgi:hypothetical protein